MGLALWFLCYSRKPSLQAWKCGVRKCFMGWTSKPAFSCGGGEGRVLQCDSLGLCLSCGSTQSMGYYIGRVFSCKESSSDKNFISSSQLEPSMMVPSFQSSRSMCESCSSSVCGQECCRNLHLNYTLWIPLHLAFYTYLLPMEGKKKDPSLNVSKDVPAAFPWLFTVTEGLAAPAHQPLLLCTYSTWNSSSSRSEMCQQRCSVLQFLKHAEMQLEGWGLCLFACLWCVIWLPVKMT